MNVQLYVVSISKPVVSATEWNVQFRLIDADYTVPSTQISPSPMGYNSGGVLCEFTKTYTASGITEWEGLIGQASDAVEFVF